MAKDQVAIYDDLFSFSGESASRGPFFRAAALITKFSPRRLKSADRREIDDRSRRELAAYCDEGNDGMWSLSEATRRSEMCALTSKEDILNVWGANADQMPDDPIQKMFAQVLKSTSSSVGDLTLADLSALTRLHDWLGNAQIIQKLSLPARSEIVDEFGFKSWLERLERYRTSHFVGRKREMEWLHRFTLSSETAFATLWGVGGVGKTALIANFVVQNCLMGSERWPFAWFDFNRSQLVRAESPTAMILEAGSQLLQQKLLSKETATQLSDFCDDVAACASPSRRAVEEDMVRHFAEILAGHDDRKNRYWWILDSLEELQDTAAGFVDYLWQYLCDVHKHLPQIRFILVGRSKFMADVKNVRTHELSSLDIPAARQLLERNGVPNEQSEYIARACEGHPLRLSLAASIYRRASEEGDPGSVVGSLRFFASTLPKHSEKQLFLRYVEHLHDDDTKSLVAPGFAVRRISPVVIEKVLAGPCGLKARCSAEAMTLFQRFIRETSLIETVDGDVAVLRKELRKEVLPLIRSAFNQEVNAIHSAAVEYYSRLRSEEARAEELYHRLMMGTDSARLDRCWRDSVADRLANSIDELPFRSQVYLAKRTGVRIDVPSSYFWEQAADVDWEWRVIGRARSLLAHDNPEKALKLVRERTYRSPASPLYVLESKALRRLGKLTESRAILEDSAKLVTQLPGFGRSIERKHAIDLLLNFFWCELQEHDCASAQATLGSLEDLVLETKGPPDRERRDDPVLALEVFMRQIEFGRACSSRSACLPIEQIKRKARDMLRNESLFEVHDIEDTPKLFRRLTAEVAWEDVDVLSRVIRLAGFGIPYPLACEYVGGAIAEWSSGRFEGTILGPLPADCSLPLVWKSWLLRESSETVSNRLASLLSSGRPPETVLQAIRDLLLLSDEGPRTEEDTEYLRELKIAQLERTRVRRYLRKNARTVEQLSRVVSESTGLKLIEIVPSGTSELPAFIREVVAWCVRLGLTKHVLRD